jgi:hypothetical protein
MGVTNRDASLLIQRNRNRALNAYKTAFTNATMTVANGSVSVAGLTGPATTGAETLIEAKLGCVACAVLTNQINQNNGAAFDPNTSLYPNNPSAGGAPSLTGTS